MSRDIKFRAWDNEHKKFNPTVAANILMQLHEPSEEIDTEYGKRFFLEQFTGLTDRNGKEIYEGDIVEGHSDGNGKVEWSRFDGGYDYVFNDDAVVGLWEVKKYLRVIGNIHENPELL